MKNLLFALLLANFAPGSALAQALPSGKTGVIPEITAAPAARPDRLILPLQKKKWTVMIYINGKNNLGGIGWYNFDQIEQAGSDGATNIVVEIGAANTNEKREIIDYAPVELLYPVSGGKTVTLASRDNVDMGDWKELVRFAGYAKKNFPADNYMLIIWGHGTGWQSSDYGKQVQGTAPRDGEALGRAVLLDDQTGNHITTIELRAALKAMGGVDVLAYNSCLMADIGVTAEISKYADYIAGSEEIFWGPMDFEIFLKAFHALPGISARQAAILFIDSYTDDFRDRNDQDITASVIDTSRIPPLAKAIKDFVPVALVSPDKAALQNAYRMVNAFRNPSECDLYDFVKLAADTTDPRLKTAAQRVMDSISSAVIKNSTVGLHVGKAHGISAYLPLKNYDGEFEQLMFDKYTGWSRLIKYLMADIPADQQAGQ
ncbi:MAG: clostripain-related cysteine peptidase [Elusimicrobiaceae bacterium]|nr:clostripain-related cysteine peptidase [Elusimicrobiaceae bacterium]